MADDPAFQSMFSSALYTIDAAASAPGWVGFVWSEANPPPTVGLADSLLNGHYLFAPVPPAIADAAAAQAYAEAVIAWLNATFGNNGFPFLGSACIWLPDANGPGFSSQPSQSVITFGQSGGSVATSNSFNLMIGQLTLSVPSQTVFSMGPRGLLFAASGFGQVAFATTDGTSAPTVTGGAGLPFLGPRAGSFTLAGTLSRLPSLGAIAGFATGLHYLHAAPGGAVRQVYPLLVTGPGLADIPYIGTVDPLDLFSDVPPLSAPADGRFRTGFGLAGTAPYPRLASWFRTAAGKPCDLVPLHGADQNNEPRPWCGTLVLQSRSAADAPVASVYLAPAGDFTLAETGGAHDGTPIELLPGLYGAERVRMAAWSEAGGFDRLRFVPGHPAYAPIFPFPPASLVAPDLTKPKPLLDMTYGTAWATALNGPGGTAAYGPGGTAAYLAQPEGSPLYAPAMGQVGGDAAAPILPPLPTPSAIPQSGSDTGLTLFPIAPYAGLGAIPGSAPMPDLGAFESQILAAKRKAVLGARSVARLATLKNVRRSRLRARQDPPPSQATTPQGLYAEIELPAGGTVDTQYHKLVLARSTAKAPAVGTVDFGFEDLTPELQDLFQTNQLMAVIVNPAKLGAPAGPAANLAAAAGLPVFNRDVVIADWQMTAAVGASLNATAYSNILILKYCSGSLLERVQNPNKWVGAAGFSVVGGADVPVALAGLSSYLQEYLGAGIDAAGRGNPLYADFARIVQDPAWQGFIVLAAKVDPSGFPDQIKGLVAGIDFTLFQAHHFGATASRVTVTGATVTMEVPSSLFALIDYQLPAFRANVANGGNPQMPLPLARGAEFGFQVLQLQALFRNAALVDFRSYVQLTINQLFLSPADTAYGAAGRLPATAVVLKGSYQRQGATAIYVFEQNATTRFLLRSNVLRSVALERVVFNTLSSDGDGIVRSRFLLSGALEFAVLSTTLPASEGGATQDADLLSFGPAADASPGAPAAGLSFSGLDVAMSSPVAAPNAVTFAFEAGKIALDPGASKARLGSLFSDLALEVDGFIAGAEDKRPIDSGFLPVAVGPKLKALSGPWFGITYKVTMGSPGGLVAQVGFSSRMLLAWAPTSLPKEASAAVFAGLQLPGAAPGAKLLSIQGVLKLSIDSLLLRRERVTGNDLSFTLRLNNVGLTFLGVAKLPPGGAINFFLFGDKSGHGSLGWYAAWVEDQPKAAIAAIARPALPAPGEGAAL